MEGDTFSGLGNGAQIDGIFFRHFERALILINEIDQNHESKIPDNLSMNVRLIRELNNNIRRVVDLYVDLSCSFTKLIDASAEGDSSGALRSDGKTSHKRSKPL
ncbi:unnamed protein product [Withania somnifera]